MSSIHLARQGTVSILTLARGKVNAFDEALVDRVRQQLEGFRHDPGTRAIVLTGRDHFFSFGFDVPVLYDYSPEAFTVFLTKFTDLYRALFEFPKPVVAALNGHTVAGGCMLAIAADCRIMASGKAKISLNEVTFGAALFAGSIEMLTHLVGQRHAEKVSLGGAMYAAEEARAIGLVDEVAAPHAVLSRAIEVASEMAARDAAAYAAIKDVLRRPAAERIRRDEAASIQRFVEIWYSPSTREQLKRIQIRP